MQTWAQITWVQIPAPASGFEISADLGLPVLVWFLIYKMRVTYLDCQKAMGAGC